MHQDDDRAAHLQQVMDAGRRIHGVMDMVDTNLADQLGVNRSDLRCLYHLIDCQQATPSEIAGAVGLTSGSVTAMLDRLVTQGLVTRARCDADRRSVVVSLDAGRRALVAAVMDSKMSIIRQKLAGLDPQELADIARTLPRFAEVIAQAAKHITQGPAPDRAD